MLTLAEIAKDWGCTPQYVSDCVKKGCPKDDFEAARLWRNAHTTRQSKKGPSPPPPAGEVPVLEYEKNGDNKDNAELFKVIDNAAIAAENAWKLLEEAFIEGKPSKISVWLNLHTKAIEARVKAESMIRAELERQKILIPMTEAKTSVRRVVEIVVSRLSAMPQNIAPRCNPHAPEHAMEILHEECTAIIADAQEVYTSWSDDRAPASNSPQL
jgi:hypothetical protein